MTLKLRAVEPQDADLFYRAENDMEAWDHSDSLAPFSMHLLREYAENYRADPVTDGQLRLIIEEKENRQTIGILDLYDISFIHGRAFVGIYILPELRRNGYALEAIEVGVAYARRRLGLRILGAKILANNYGSIELFHKANFLKGGTLPDWHISDGCSVDMFIVYRFI
ncbi:MAG: GNAT family N-acetyltransferase [Muribaculaceae bacterium]|nr:GNAT family N-acetyltransferase [Muribaculaceae bacterium]